MTYKCGHSTTDREDAIADGGCTFCLADEVNRLSEALEVIKEKAANPGDFSMADIWSDAASALKSTQAASPAAPAVAPPDAVDK